MTVIVPSLLVVSVVVSAEDVDDVEELEELELASDEDDVLNRLAIEEPPMEEIEEDMDWTPYVETLSSSD
ncbi:hypothetical protein [Acetobacter sp. UBA5411]|uniref:hypothetical protein n=1 Tax=Acetobacter sp. UBA5411 TaxID=1945905 RepID=UPI0025C4D098|nr:hypothetical protein [Acetobacter sp. UBA5411]